jgi:choline kinase
LTLRDQTTSSPSPAHVVVLAAGRGSRLGALGGATPKWLLRVGDRTLADRQLEGIARAGDAVASVHVVTGHAAEVIDAELAERDDDVRVLPNPQFAELNNWWSLLRALRALPAEGPVAVLNADLLADPEHVAAFLHEAGTLGAEGVLAVDLDKDLTDESMKVALAADGTLSAIGKVAVEDPVGEYIGMLLVRGRALRDLREALERFVGRPDAANEWYEGAIGRTAAEGTPWRVWAMPTGGWIEIDDDDDLRFAESLVGA